MGSRQAARQPVPAAVGLCIVVPTVPSRPAAFRSVVTALLHAGFGFGRELPGDLVYSYDVSGEHYIDPRQVPAGSLMSFERARARLSALAPYYNHSIGLSFAAAPGAVDLCARVYDEADALVFNLDFPASVWRRLTLQRAAELGVTGLLNAGRTLFTLLPAELLLIGPSDVLADLPFGPSEQQLQAVPIAMLAQDRYPTPGADTSPPLYQEQLSRGRLVVRGRDARHYVQVPAVAGGCTMVPKGTT